MEDRNCECGLCDYCVEGLMLEDEETDYPFEEWDEEEE